MVASTIPTVIPSSWSIRTLMMVSFPKMNWVLYVITHNLPVRVRSNGCFAHADFTVCTQWFHGKHPHLPYILMQPMPREIKDHLLFFLWWDVQQNTSSYWKAPFTLPLAILTQ